MNVTIKRVHAGRIEAVLDPEGQVAPALSLCHGDDILAAVVASVEKEDGTQDLTVDIPARVISDGVVLLDIRAPGQPPLASVTIIAGAPLDHDLHSDVALLRAELEVVKATLRRISQS